LVSVAKITLERKQENRDVSGVASYWSARGEEVAQRLQRAAEGQNSLVACATAGLLARCAEERNIWTGRGLLNQEGVPFEGVGTLWQCGLRLCPSCCAAMARASRRKAREAISYLKTLLTNQTRWRWRFRSLVLTMPLMRGADVTDAIARINDGFRRLTNREFWKSRVVGGIKSVEFTVRIVGYHAHIHLLILSDFLPVDAQTEAKWQGYTKRHNLASGNLASELGHCLRAAGAVLDGDPNVAVYDVLRQGQRRHGDNTISLERALQETCKYLTKSESWDAIPDDQLVKIAEVERWPRMFELLGKARLSKREERNPSSLVHTHPLINGGVRAASWRELLETTDLEEWNALMTRRIDRAREFRRDQLAWRHPEALFKTLDGAEFGLRVKPPPLSVAAQDKEASNTA
jgi:plasmid rolling circle replication initiator protein Rep